MVGASATKEDSFKLDGLCAHDLNTTYIISVSTSSVILRKTRDSFLSVVEVNAGHQYLQLYTHINGHHVLISYNITEVISAESNAQ